MPRFPAHTIENAPEAARETPEQLGRRRGKVLNIQAGMAHSPVVTAAYAGIPTAARGHGKDFNQYASPSWTVNWLRPCRPDMPGQVGTEVAGGSGRLAALPVPYGMVTGGWTG